MSIQDCFKHPNWIAAKKRSQETVQRHLQNRIDEYNKHPKLCKQCQKPLSYMDAVRKNKKIFCSCSCAATYNNLRKERKYGLSKQCLYCGKGIDRTNRHHRAYNKYCNHICSHNHRIQRTLDAWLKDNSQPIFKKALKRYLLDKVDNKCEQCSWSKKNPTTGNSALELHHKDGNPKNNCVNNLEILCPNCHSLTSNFKRIKRASVA